MKPWLFFLSLMQALSSYMRTPRRTWDYMAAVSGKCLNVRESHTPPVQTPLPPAQPAGCSMNSCNCGCLFLSSRMLRAMRVFWPSRPSREVIFDFRVSLTVPGVPCTLGGGSSIRRLEVVFENWLRFTLLGTCPGFHASSVTHDRSGYAANAHGKPVVTHQTMSPLCCGTAAGHIS